MILPMYTVPEVVTHFADKGIELSPRKLRALGRKSGSYILFGHRMLFTVEDVLAAFETLRKEPKWLGSAKNRERRVYKSLGSTGSRTLSELCQSSGEYEKALEQLEKWKRPKSVSRSNLN